MFAESRKQSPSLDEITSVCFRVTRGCNLSCSYCQAPPNAKQQKIDSMLNALNWLQEKGCKGVKFTGGEPTAIPNLTVLIHKCKSLNMTPTVVTNGTIFASVHVAPCPALSIGGLGSPVAFATRVRSLPPGHAGRSDRGVRWLCGLFGQKPAACLWIQDICIVCGC